MLGYQDSHPVDSGKDPVKSDLYTTLKRRVDLWTSPDQTWNQTIEPVPL